jgi:PIN domain nuclease of toxin-antitoxin system
LLDDLDWNMARLSAHYLSLGPAEAVLAGGLSAPHRDPFDRLLAAQARLRGLTLVSSDGAFGGFDGLNVLW